MFYTRYLDDDYIEELYDNYDISYLKSIDEDNFNKIYNLFKKYKFDYMEDIILRYIDIFELEPAIVESKLNKLIKVLSSKYVDIIGNNMTYLEYIMENEQEIQEW